MPFRICSRRRVRETCARVFQPEMLREDRRAEYLRENRDNSWLSDLDGNQRDRGRGGSSSRQDEVSLERQEYLERREKLKELERLKLKSRNGIYGNVSDSNKREAGEKTKSSGSSYGDLAKAHPQGKPQSHAKPKPKPKPQEQQPKKHLPFNNFGSFFGPSQPVVSRRIIEEARAREEAARIARIEGRAVEADRRLPSSKPVARAVSRPTKPVNEATKKALALKEARDYSFLFSDEPVNAVQAKKATRDGLGSGVKPSAPTTVHKVASRDSSHRTSTPVQAVRNRPSGGGERESAGHSSSRPLAQRKEPVVQRVLGQAASSSRPVSKPSAPSRPAPISKPNQSGGTGSRPSSAGAGGSRQVSTSKHPVPAARPTHQNVAAGTRPGGGTRTGDAGLKARVDAAPRRAPPQDARRMPAGDARRPVVDPRKPVVDARRPVVDPRRPAAAPSRVPSRSAVEMERRASARPVSRMEEPKRSEYRRPRSPDEYSDSFIDDGDDTGDVSSMIQKMFGYNPNKYRDLDDEDDRDMEVGFSRIQAEERRSAKLAREEDEIELERIEAEERAERLRREKKRRKL